MADYYMDSPEQDWWSQQPPPPSAAPVSSPQVQPPQAGNVVGAPAAGGNDINSWVDTNYPGTYWANTGQGSDYWKQRMAEDNGAHDRAYWLMRMNAPNYNPGGGSGGMGATPEELAAFGVPGSSYASNPFAGGYQEPAPPAWLQGPYTSPTWQGGDFQAPTKPDFLNTPFAAPTQAELESSPGYGARLAAGAQAINRKAAASGTIYNGGTQQALERYGQDYASNEYGNLYGQKLSTRQQNVGEFEGDFARAFGQYQTKYGQFQDTVTSGRQDRQQNQNEFQQNVIAPGQVAYQNQYRQYLDEQARTLNDYLTNYTIKRTGIQDFLRQQNTSADRGYGAIAAGRPN